MQAILRRHPSQRIVTYYEPGAIVDVPHVLVYDPADHAIERVIHVYRRHDADAHNCDIVGKQIEPSFFDLTVDCH
jgi:hypothetical protein